MASVLTDTSRLQAYEALRELVRKVECGELEILNMSIGQESPEMNNMRSVDGRMVSPMVMRYGDITIEIKLARRFDSPIGEPRDEAGRLRGNTRTTAGPEDMRNNPWAKSNWNVTAQADYVKKNGLTKAADMVAVAMRGRKDGFDYDSMTREELMQIAGVTREEQKRIAAEIGAEETGAAKYGEPTFEGVNFPRPQTQQAPVDPMNYGARKVDLD